MKRDAVLFDRALERALELALDGETLDSLMTKYATAVARGDLERVRLLDEMLRLVVALGNQAVTAEQSNRWLDG